MTSSPNAPRWEVEIQAVRKFIAEKCEELIEASGLLGGAAAQRRCLRLCSRIRQASRLDRHCRRELRWMQDLLYLQNVDDPDATDPAHYCDLAPDDPAVHALCRLAEALGDLLIATGSEQTQAVSVENSASNQDAA
nr:hypothetical protein [uncultured Roseovarius sp.]